MAQRAKTDSGLSAKAEFDAQKLLCEGHDQGTVAERLGLDYGLVYAFSRTAYALELIEAARAGRLSAAARDASKQAEEWAEQDRQEKEASTALESAAIQLIPRNIKSLPCEDRLAAVRQIQALADTIIKAQKARRIASGRPVESTVVETNSSAKLLEQIREAAGLANADDINDGRAPDAVPPAPTPTSDPSQ